MSRRPRSGGWVGGWLLVGLDCGGVGSERGGGGVVAMRVCEGQQILFLLLRSLPLCVCVLI